MLVKFCFETAVFFLEEAMLERNWGMLPRRLTSYLSLVSSSESG